MSWDSPLTISLLALAASFQFSMVVILGRRGLHVTDALTGATINIGVSLTIFVVAGIFLVKAEYWHSPALWILASIGILRPALSNPLGFEGSRRLGPTVSTTVESVSPFFAIVGGVVFLSELVTPVMAVGAAGIVAGVVFLTSQGRARRDWPYWALLFPFGAALIRSSAHVGARWGLGFLPTDISSVIFSGLVAYMVSFAITLTASLLRRGGLRGHLSREGFFWFTLTGICNAGAIFSLNTALSMGQVARVSPLIATFPLFTMALSFLFYKRERITWRTVAGVLLVAPSVVLITTGN